MKWPLCLIATVSLLNSSARAASSHDAALSVRPLAANDAVGTLIVERIEDDVLHELHTCPGVLIAPDVVLTRASCVPAHDTPDELQIEFMLGSAGRCTVSPIYDWERHPGYVASRRPWIPPVGGGIAEWQCALRPEPGCEAPPWFMDVAVMQEAAQEDIALLFLDRAVLTVRPMPLSVDASAWLAGEGQVPTSGFDCLALDANTVVGTWTDRVPAPLQVGYSDDGGLFALPSHAVGAVHVLTRLDTKLPWIRATLRSGYTTKLQRNRCDDVELRGFGQDTSDASSDTSFDSASQASMGDQVDERDVSQNAATAPSDTSPDDASQAAQAAMGDHVDERDFCQDAATAPSDTSPDASQASMSVGEEPAAMPPPATEGAATAGEKQPPMSAETQVPVGVLAAPEPPAPAPVHASCQSVSASGLAAWGMAVWAATRRRTKWSSDKPRVLPSGRAIAPAVAPQSGIT